MHYKSLFYKLKKARKLQILDTHKIIGVDIDDTLIGNELASTRIQEYILNNYHQKNFYLITFRTRELMDSIWQDIAYENAQLNEKIFRGVFGVPVDIRIGYQHYRSTVNRIATNTVNDPEDEEKLLKFTPYKDQFLEWKGKKAHELGCTILIDDRTERVRQGCTKYNIKLVHPDVL